MSYRTILVHVETGAKAERRLALAAGLAERRSHPTDRRVKMVALSHTGVEVLAQVRKILGQPPASFAALSTPELLRLRLLLAKLDAAGPPQRG